MSIASTDLVEYLSTSAGSTGGAISGSTVTSGVANNVNPNNTDAQLTAGGTDYRKTFWKNVNATDAAQVPVIWASAMPTNNTLQLGLGFNNSDDTDPAQGNMTAWGANAKVALISDGADTRVATIYGMDNSGTPVPVTETVTLTGAVEVLSVNTYSKVWAISLSAISGSRTVLAKQGTGGTTRGTIGINKRNCWLWVTASSKPAGIALPNLPASTAYGVWRKRSWTAGASTVRPDSQTIRMEENA